MANFLIGVLISVGVGVIIFVITIPMAKKKPALEPKSKPGKVSETHDSTSSSAPVIVQ